MSDFQMIRGHLADMAQQIDASALLVYRAAWLKDSRRGRFSREASMAKLFATEEAQRVVDRAVQLHGGDGVRKGHIVERLYRDVRALRIYEGASDLQRLIIAADMLPNGTKRSLRARHRQNCA
jgi:acyl-CoA dehydrogenase